MSFIQDDLNEVTVEVKTGTFEPVEEGQHVGRIIEIIHIGTHENTAYQDKHGNNLINDQFIFVYEIPDDMIMDGELKGQPKTINQFVNKKTAKKSTLRALYEAAEKRNMEDSEASSHPMFTLLDKVVMLNIVHKKNKKGGISAGVSLGGISAVHKSINVPARNYELKALYLPKFSQEVFDSLPEWQQKLVTLSDVPKDSQTKG